MKVGRTVRRHLGLLARILLGRLPSDWKEGDDLGPDTALEEFMD